MTDSENTHSNEINGFSVGVPFWKPPMNPFGYFKPSEEMLPLIQKVREQYTTLHNFLLTLPASRQRAIAITELETSAMWVIKGLVLNDPNSSQPHESGVTGD